jgi:hypothetical protein
VDCADLSAAQVAVAQGFVLGQGPYWLGGFLDDFGSGGDGLAPGSMTSADSLDGGITLPAANQIAFAADAYAVAHSIELNVTISGDEGGGDALSCGGDAGGDAAGE